MEQGRTSLRWRAAALLTALCMMWGLAVQLALPACAEAGAGGLLQNGDFEDTAGAAWEGEPVGWDVRVSDGGDVWGDYAVQSDEWAQDPANHYLHLANYDKGMDLTAEATQTIALTAGTYTASIQSAGDNEGEAASELALTAVSGSTVLASSPIALGGWDTWATTEIVFTLEADAEVTVGVTGTLVDSSYCDLDNAVLEQGGQPAAEGYTVTVTPAAAAVCAGDTVTLTAKVTYNGVEVTDLAAAGLYLWWWTDTWAEGHTDGLSDAVYSNYDDNSGLSLTADVTLPSEGTYYIAAELQDSDYADVTETVFATIAVAAPEADTAVEAEINVEKVPGLPDDFIMGLDISSVISEFNSGVTYKDFAGNTIDNVTDFCKFLAECGVTHVRVRVWNDPYDSDGNGYGGGNNDVAAAAEIAKGCAAAGLKLLVDFHCSDFWTDPSKQMVPKAWTDDTVEQKAEALQAFLTDSLTQIAATGAEIAMVQIGNETTGGFIGETSTADMCTLFSAGSEAVRSFDSSIQVVIHVTNPEKSNMTTWAKNLSDNGVDYDILATSYYPSWHGTLENLKSQLQAVQDTYGKAVMVAETSYAFTLDDTDGHDNTIRDGNNTDMMCETQYPFTVQGQASYLRDLIAAVNEAGGLGVYYWEPAWITVGDTTGLTGDAYTAQVNANKETWEKYGSGWASSYAAEYDPDDAGKWYGGSAVDNQALFAADGAALASANVWNYVRTGAVSNSVSVDAIGSAAQTIYAGEAYALPETITVTYNTGAVEESVVWAQADVDAIDAGAPGAYVVHGTVAFSKTVDAGDYAGQTSAPVTYTLTVKAPNLITDADDASFEKGDNFTIAGSGINLPATDDPKEGSYSMHWWSETATTGTVTYDKVITLAPGSYAFEASAQGYAGDAVTLKILDTEGNVLFSGAPAILTGWANWMTPEVRFTVETEQQIHLQIEVNIQAGGWGTVDCLYLYKTADVAVTPPEGGDTGSTGSTGGTGNTGNPDGTVPAAGTETAAPAGTGTAPRTGELTSKAMTCVAFFGLLALAGAAVVVVFPRRKEEEE